MRPVLSVGNSKGSKSSISFLSLSMFFRTVLYIFDISFIFFHLNSHHTFLKSTRSSSIKDASDMYAPTNNCILSLMARFKMLFDSGRRDTVKRRTSVRFVIFEMLAGIYYCFNVFHISMNDADLRRSLGYLNWQPRPYISVFLSVNSGAEMVKSNSYDYSKKPFK